MLRYEYFSSSAILCAGYHMKAASRESIWKSFPDLTLSLPVGPEILHGGDEMQAFRAVFCFTIWFRFGDNWVI
ncbi:hypothetical protein FKM82_023926 [Ascaphus truei]